MSRNRRTEKFENLIYEAEKEEDLEEISRKYELALQMRLIGPHQGLRLERIRSKQENILEYELSEPKAEDLKGKEIVTLDDTNTIDTEGNTEVDDNEVEETEEETQEDN